MTQRSVAEAKNQLSDLIDRALAGENIVNPNYGYGVRGFPKDQGFDSIGLRQLSLKPDPGGSPQWRWISQRSTACAPTARVTNGGRIRPDRCRFGLVADERFNRVTGWTEAS